ncbi:hypothetical protein SCLCIDRAFT_1178169 [Scleroderma citrinum Foug A]|uniref:Uncharacterized protein n=1 Tax=Scleroderma citrinum Foug A TaxID=1036808 RepID=A0A0C3E1X7_9AGAM|nr:hypothetical protein SCLCIDRAFT_1178169 [Scleroderma citrinum Foug A]
MWFPKCMGLDMLHHETIQHFTSILCFLSYTPNKVLSRKCNLPPSSLIYSHVPK